MNKVLLSCLLLTASNYVLADAGNIAIQSFSKAKKLLQKEVYFDHRQTIYCNASFDEKKNITLPSGYQSTKYKKRAKRVEWEHVVPAENFGRTFSEWREGDAKCVKKDGKPFKGRNCANKVNKEYRLIQSDLYNLFPAIGSVNAMRSNFNFTMLPGEESDFGSCAMKIDSKKAEPPIEARGRIARTYMYMDRTYSRYSMSKQQRKLMAVWDKQFPATEWECLRAKRIEKLQGNINTVMTERCSS